MAGLAVADAFTVESYYNSTLYSYAISIQNGVPVTLHLGNTPTNEPNGLKLSVTVNHDDMHHYTEKASSLYKYFDHKPILNNNNVDIELDISEHISDNWFIKKSENTYSKANYVVMSQVAYEIPYNSAVKTQGFQNLVIKAEPGSVTFNPGRESLSLNKPTINYLNAAFERIKDEYVQSATNTLVLANNDSELMSSYRSLVSVAPSEVAKAIDPTPFCSSEFKALFSSPYYTSNTPSFHNLAMGTTFFSDTNDLISIVYKGRHYKTAKPLLSDNSITPADFFNAKHVLIDVKSKFRSIINNHYEAENLITWQRKDKSDIDEAVKESKRYLDTLGIKYDLASKLVAELGEDLPSSVAPREGFYTSDIGSFGASKAKKMDKQDLTNQTYLYVKLKNTTPIIQDEKIGFKNLYYVYQILSKITSMPPVKGVAKKYQSYVNDLDNWVDFETYIKDKASNTAFKLPIENNIPYVNGSAINKHTYHLFPKDIVNYYNEVNRYYNFTVDKSFINDKVTKDLMESLGATFEYFEPDDDVDITELHKTYPKAMHYLTERGWYRDITPELISYIAKLENYHAVHTTEQQ